MCTGIHYMIIRPAKVRSFFELFAICITENMLFYPF